MKEEKETAWINWDGSNPYGPQNIDALTRVKVILRCGYENEGERCQFNWHHNLDDPGEAEIVAYLVLRA